MCFLKLYSRYISFNQFWCIYQSHHPSNNNTNGVLKTWLIVGPTLHLLLLSVITILCTIYEKNVFSQGDPVSHFVDVMQLVFPVSIHVIVIVEGMLKKRYDHQTKKLIDRLESAIAEEGIDLKSCNSQLKRRYFIPAILVQLIALIVEIYIIATITESPDWVRNWIARIFSFAYARMAIFQYVFIVEYLSSRLAVISKDLLCLKEYSMENKVNSSHDLYLWKKIAFAKQTHLHLCRLCDLHNRRHSFFILGTMTSFFICLTIDFYWMYANMYYGDNIFILRKFYLQKNEIIIKLTITYFVESFLCGIPPIFSVLAIFIPSQRIIQSANNVAHNLHGLKRNIQDVRTSAVVSQQKSFCLNVVN